MSISRRALAPAVAAAAILSGRAQAARSLDPVRDMALIHRKLHLRLDDGIVYWWMVGTKFGQIDAAVTPLFDMQIGSMFRVKGRPDGGYDLTSLEIVFYTDLETGARLRTWTNPYTGEPVQVGHSPVGPATQSFGPDGRRTGTRREMGGAVIVGEHTLGPTLIAGDDVWIRSNSTARVEQKDGSGRPFIVNDWSEYHGRATEIADAAKPWIPATARLQEITSWAKWQNMGERPGNQTSRAVGAKVATYDAMPETWRKLMAELHPDVAKDPVGALDRPAARFDR